jgi:hypothetical protein
MNLSFPSNPPVEHIPEAAMQPTLILGVVVMTLDVFIRYVRVVAAKPINFLFKSDPRAFHKQGRAAFPHLACPFNCSRYTIAVSFNDVLINSLTIQGRQFPVPIHDLFDVSGCPHMNILSISALRSRDGDIGNNFDSSVSALSFVA